MLDRRDSKGLFRWPRSSANRITLAMAGCGFALIVGTSAFIAHREHETALHEARVVARSAAFSLADHASRLFEVSDLALRTATLSLGDLPWDDAQGSKALWQELRNTADALPYLRDLYLVDADEHLRVATLAFPAPTETLSDKSAFNAARTGVEGIVISDPTLGRLTGRPSFLIARRLAEANGRFRGIAAATADPDYFTTYWRRLALPNDADVALIRTDTGRILVRLPEAPPVPDSSMEALRAAAAVNPLAGRYRPVPDRLAFYQRVGDLPLLLVVSYSVGAVDEAWLAWLWTFLLFPAAAILALLGFLALVRRQSRIEAQSTREVHRARVALAAANSRLEQRVAERTADLQESNGEIQRFAYIVSHDLRAPLVNIMGFTSELERLRGDLFPPTATSPETLRDDFDEAIGFIRSSIDKMDRLIRAILLLARQGNRVFAPEPVDMGALMRSIADGVAHRAQAAGAVVSVGPMPSLVIDRIAAEQVFSNLVDNAIKYLRPDVPGTVSITATVADHRATFHVADNGRGIAPRDHARVFELFRRSGTQDQPGDGIGLAHVRTLVRQLGGTITLTSTPGAGSIFAVDLPREPYGASS